MPTKALRAYARAFLLTGGRDEAGTALQILIADHDPAWRGIARAALEAIGDAVTCVSDGAAAAAAVERRRVAMLAVVEQSLPGLSASEVCRRARASSVPPVYVLLVGSDAEPEDRIALADAGADDILFKPYEPADLHARAVAAVRTLAAQMRTPSGAVGNTAERRLVAMCSYCKKIRVEGEEWLQLEGSLRDLGERVTHGICPECYPEVLKSFNERR